MIQRHRAGLPGDLGAVKGATCISVQFSMAELYKFQARSGQKMKAKE